MKTQIKAMEKRLKDQESKQEKVVVNVAEQKGKCVGLGKNAYLNGIYKIDRFRIIGAYGQNRDGAVYGNKDWDNWSIGVKYNLTKKSELLAAWNRRMDNTSDLDIDTFTLGVNAKFGY